MTKTTSTLARRALRGLMGTAASMALLGFAPLAQAQDDAAAAEEDEEIIVTGSRLITTTMETPIPVTAVQAEELDAMDPTSLIASVSQLPQFYANQTPTGSNFFTRSGTGSLNLRGLGANRTLTLLNGRRFPSASAFGGVDINLFPEAMIKGIEVVTGGASAAYGTDAVAGVTNFLINTDFNGLQIDLQGGMTGRGDAKNYEVKAAAGFEIGDRGHFLFALSKAQQDGVFNYEGRDWYQAVGALQINGVWTDYANVRSAHGSFDGIITSSNAALNGLQFKPDGTYAMFVPGSTSTGAVGTSGARTVGGSGDDLGGEVSNLAADTDRYSLFAYADYDITDNVTLFAQYVRGQNHQWNYNTRGYLMGNPQGTVTIYKDNAFLPQGINDLMTANSVASVNLRRVGSLEDIGLGYVEDTTTQNVITAGFNAEVGGDGFMSGWKINGYYQYGHSERVWDQLSLRLDRVYAALDAVKDANGNIVCRVSTFAAGAAAFPGCQPLNLFGRGNASAAAIDYVLGNDVGVQVTTPLYFANLGYSTNESLSFTSVEPKRNITTFQQNFAEVSAAGELFNGWAGPISLALGASYRQESIYQVVQDTTNRASDFDTKPFTVVKCDNATLGLRGVPAGDCANNAVGHQFSKVSNIQGETTVKEAFAETLIPLIDGQGIKGANLSLAGRWADYTGAGVIWAYKAGLDVSINDSIRLRGTYSRDVRAGNLSERFDKTGGAATVDDPRTTAQESIAVTTFSGGNPNIKPESADTLTAGVVFQPEFAPGLSMSLDWYQIKINDAISRVGFGEVLRRCLVGGEQQFCDLVTMVNDVPTNVGDQFVNVGLAKVEGVDFELGYRSDLKLFGGGDESIAARMFGTYMLNRSDVSSTGTVSNALGVTGLAPDSAAGGLFPKFKANLNLTYKNGPFTAFFQGRLIGSGKRAIRIGGADAVEGVNIADNSVPAIFYLDARLAYEFNVGDSTMEVFVAATNLLDKDPPVTGAFAVNLAGSAAQANTGLFDVLGQRFNVGVKFKL